jgi:hypothetical protein
MRALFLFFIVLYLFQCCTPKQNSAFSPVECIASKMPEFDEIKVKILNDQDKPIKDTIIGKIEKRRTVFKPCRVIIYRAKFSSDKNELITNARIKMMANGKRWQVQSEKQDEIIIQYEYTNEDFEENKLFQLNKSLLSNYWTNQSIEGVIENVEEVWMHPFRSNQYNFTEVAPFPTIKFPLEVGKTWSDNLSIQNGWGDWENTNGSHEYKVTAKESISTPYGKIDDSWKVESESTYAFGQSKFTYWFNEKLGFVKMDYLNYGKQSLVIEMEEVIEK